MIKYLRNGVGIPANGGFIPMGLPGYSDKIGYKYNPDYAKELITISKKGLNIKKVAMIKIIKLSKLFY